MSRVSDTCASSAKPAPWRIENVIFGASALAISAGAQGATHGAKWCSPLSWGRARLQTVSLLARSRSGRGGECVLATRQREGRFVHRGSNVLRHHVKPRLLQAVLAQPTNAWPNPSLKLTRYGSRPWPGCRYAVHCRQPGQGRLPPQAA